MFPFREKILEVKSPDQLDQILASHHIDVSTWGQSATKTPTDLFGEINAGETVLAENRGQLVRNVSVANVTVYYRDGDKKLRLIEEKQIFANGESRYRTMESSVSEKLKAGESPKNAAKRGVKEELGIEGDLSLKAKGKSERQQVSPSYPGVASKYTTFRFEAWLNNDQYRPDGYVEDDGKKRTYFVWKVA